MGKTQSKLLVNLGCGRRIHPAWKNLDLHASLPGVEECDLLSGIPIADGAAQAVYSAAVLEHIRRPDVPKVLKECFRVLASGGVARIAVPDFEQQARLYLALVARASAGEPGAAAELEWLILEMIDQVGRERKGGAMAEYLATRGEEHAEFVTKRIGKEASNLIEALKGRTFDPFVDLITCKTWMVRGSWLGVLVLKFLLRSKNIKNDLAALEAGRFRLFKGEIHQWVYDRFSLMRLMEGAGFCDMQVMEPGSSRIPNWPGFNLEIDAAGHVEKPDLVIVEGTKR